MSCTVEVYAESWKRVSTVPPPEYDISPTMKNTIRASLLFTSTSTLFSGIPSRRLVPIFARILSKVGVYLFWDAIAIRALLTSYSCLLNSMRSLMNSGSASSTSRTSLLCSRTEYP